MDQKNGNKGYHQREHTPPLHFFFKSLINCSGLVQMAFLFQGDQSRDWF